MYKGLAITHIGTEEVCATEIKELINADIIKKDNKAVIFKTKDYLDFCKLCYKAQSVSRILLLIKEIKVFPELEKTVQEIKKTGFEYKDWLGKNTFIRVDCERLGEHNFRSVDIASEISEIIKKKNKDVKFSFKNQDLIFYLFINNEKGYLGIDFSGRDLSKRDYKIFQSRTSIKGTLGYSLVRMSGFKKSKYLADAFTKGGIIPIEAGLYELDFPVNFFSKDKFIFHKFKIFENTDFKKFFENIDADIKKNHTNIYALDKLYKFISFAKKNAKIAGISNYINFSKKSLEWLDLKFDKNQLDYLVSYPPELTNRKDKKEIQKIYNEIFYQSKYILNKKGKILFLTRKTKILKQEAEKYGFRVKEKSIVFSGKQKYYVVKFQASNKD